MRPIGEQKVVGSNPSRSGKILLWSLDHEIFPMVVLSLPLVQEGKISVSVHKDWITD